VQFKTISTPDDNKENAASFIGFHKFLRETYADVFSKMEVKEFPPFGLLLKWEGKNPELKPIMFMAHQDVVPVEEGTADQWAHPPFAGVIENGMIYGRGTLDDKGSLIGILEAMSYLIKEGYTPERSIYLQFGDTEEILGDTAFTVAKYFKDNNIMLDSVFDEGGFIIADLMTQVPGPVAVIGVTEKGYLDLELSTKAKGGHSSMPLPQTTVGIISKAISRLEENQLPMHFEGVGHKFLEDLARHMPFKDRFFLANTWLFKPFMGARFSKTPATAASFRTTTAATVFNAGERPNILPAEAKALVNFRIMPGETVESVIDHVKKKIHDPRIKINKRKNSNPSPVSSYDNNVYRAIAKGIYALFPEQQPLIVPYVTIGATDSRHFAEVSENQYRFLSALITNAELTGFHGANERLSVENVGKMIQFYMLLVKELT
jgi:carboxypeptidase PM20D1